MISLSNIIKSEYVFYEKSNHVEKLIAAQISTSKEDIYEAYNQRETIIKNAAEEALKIVSTSKRNAYIEVAEIKKKAFDEAYNAGLEIGKNKGYEEGYQLGLKEIKEQLLKENENRINEISTMLQAIENKKQFIISKYEDGITKLSLDIAEKIMKQKIDLKDNSLSRIVESVISDYKNVEWVKIYVSEKDEVKMIEADKTLIDELEKISRDVKIEVKKDLSKGSCIVETPNSIVDASIDTQLSNLKEIILSK